MLLLSSDSALLASIRKFYRNWKKLNRCAYARLTHTTPLPIAITAMVLRSIQIHLKIEFDVFQYNWCNQKYASFRIRKNKFKLGQLYAFFCLSTFPFTKFMLNYHFYLFYWLLTAFILLFSLRFFQSNSATCRTFFLKTLFHLILNLFQFHYQFILVVSAPNGESIFFIWKWVQIFGFTWYLYMCHFVDFTSSTKKKPAQLCHWIVLLQFNCFQCTTNVCCVVVATHIALFHFCLELNISGNKIQQPFQSPE